MNVLPEGRLAIIALCNASPVGAPEAVCRSFVDLVSAGKVERDWLTLFGGVFAKMDEPTYGRDADYASPQMGAPPPAPFSAYIGTYRNDLFGPLSVTQDVDGLRLTVGKGRAPYAMRHFSGDIFTFQPVGENAFGPSPMRFALDEQRIAQSVTVDYFNASGQGRFLRL